MQSKEQTFIIGDQVWLSCPTAIIGGKQVGK